MSCPDWLTDAVRSIHEAIRSTVVRACETSSSRQMSEVADDGPGDTIYAIDRISDTLLTKLFEERIAARVPIILIAEGLPGGEITLPLGTAERDAEWRIIADPIDGTRCLMYQKRSAWILTGVAPNRGEATSLADIELAVQTEIPLIKQHLCDTLWASKGSGARAERVNRFSGERVSFSPVPSTASSLVHGFATVTRFFSGARDVLAAIDDEIQFSVLGASPSGKALSFEDQYLSTGGQLYELAMGRDRFLADLRPLLRPILSARGSLPGLCCHPYDLCTELIAREAGVIITSEAGKRLDANLDVETDVSWIGYANESIRRQVEPVIQQCIRRHGLQESLRMS
jgi:fructose-1,6-bisphosphatase/inositol monophosphatase family enzyme